MKRQPGVISGLSRVLRRHWRRLGITTKFSALLGLLLGLLALLSVASVGAVLLIQRETESLIVRNTQVERLVLEMDGSLQQARSMTKDFVWRYETIGYAAALEVYGRPAEEQIEQVRRLATDLQDRVAEPGMAWTWQDHAADLNLYVSAARRYATTVEETANLIGQLASDSPSSPGSLSLMATHASALGQALELIGDEGIMVHYHDMRSFEKDYLLARQRPLMQSAFNAAVLLRKEIVAATSLAPDLTVQALRHLDDYLAVAERTLDLDTAVRAKLNEFDLQAEAVDPISDELIAFSEDQVARARARFRQTTRAITAGLLALAVLGLAIGIRVAHVLDRDVTRNVVSLTRTASDIEAGDLAARAYLDCEDELGLLATSLNAMASRLSSLISGLEMQVAERTRDLRDQRDFAESLINTAQAIILVLDPQGRITRYNPYMETLGGYSLAETKGRDWFEMFVPPPAHDDVKGVFRRLGELDAGSVHTNPILTKDGQERIISWSNRALHDGAGAPVGVLAIGLDNTERVRAEAALRASEENLHVTLDSIGDAVIVADMTGNVTRMNPVAETLTGWPESEALGQPMTDVFQIINADTRLSVENPVDKVLRSGRVEGLANHTVLVSRDGLEYQIADSGAPIRSDDGGVLGVVLVFRDVTEEEKNRAERQRVGRLESIGTLAGGIAHDFNNMLSVILGHAEMALDDASPSQPVYEHLDEIRGAARHSADLTRQLLAFARRQPIAPMRLDLNEAIAEMLSMLRRLIGEQIDLTWEPQANLWPVMLDGSQLGQLLTNLCVNARDAISSVGTISLSTANCAIDAAFCASHPEAMVGDYVRLIVQDDGCGMSPEVLQRIFEPFFTTKGVGQGTGLGLATAYGVIKQNNGFIVVESQLGQGTAFGIYLPRVEDARGSAVPASESPQRLPRGRGEVVLLVEDEAAILRMAKRLLERSGYAVLAAGSPLEGIRLARAHLGSIDLLITDVIMPEMSGWDMARVIRQERPKTECLFMSGYTADVIADQGVLSDDVHFIEKPFEVRDLATRVREILDPDR